MSIFYRGRYIIDVNNKSYISAIAKYNKNVNITDIKCDNNLIIGNDLGKDKCFENLTNIVEHARHNGVKTLAIDYMTADSYALHGIFPEVDISNVVNNENNEVAKALTERLKAISHAHHYDMGIMFGGSLFDHVLTKQEAIESLKIACKTLNIQNAAHLASINTMIFEYGGECFALTYGPHSDLISLSRFSLDIDDGFFNKYGDIEKGLEGQVMSQLNSFFKQWQAQNYKGNLFPETLNLNFNPSQNQVYVSHQGIFSNSTGAQVTQKRISSNPTATPDVKDANLDLSNASFAFK